MFRHQGKARTLSHNLKIASLLSFVAGIVNVTGFLAVQRLTTNVTGHFAFFVDEVFKLHPWDGLVYFFYVLFFLLGAFMSNFLVEFISRKDERYVFVVPVFLESMILFLIAINGNYLMANNPNTIAYSLLFTMGLQNSLVTQISNSIVRTTHLTGLFTDLGIELSQLFFYTSKEQEIKLLSSIKLRATIISFFFIGGVTSGMFYTIITTYTLLIAVVILLIGLTYDTVKYKYITHKRRPK